MGAWGTGHLRGKEGNSRSGSGGGASGEGEERRPGAWVFWGVLRGTAWEDWGMEMREIHLRLRRGLEIGRTIWSRRRRFQSS